MGKLMGFPLFMRYQPTIDLHRDPLSDLQSSSFSTIAAYIEHQSAEKRLSVFEEILKCKDRDVLIKY